MHTDVHVISDTKKDNTSHIKSANMYVRVLICIRTHTHTHTYTYVYIYVYII